MAYSYSLLEHFLFLPWPWEKSNSVSGKVILITGASYGIGEALAYRLAKAGAHLILIARTKDKLEKVKEQVEKLGGSAEVFAFDMRDKDALEKCIEQLLSSETKIDVVVNNAGKSIRRSVLDSLDRYHDVERSMAINYHAPVRLSLALIPVLLKYQGQIIQVSAVNVLLPPAPYWSAYQSSKVAFDQWFRSVAPELKAKGVAMTSVYLPLVKTRMMSSEQYQHFPAMHPEHVANLLLRKIIRRSASYRPWWLPPVVVLAFIVQPFVDMIILKRIRRKGAKS